MKCLQTDRRAAIRAARRSGPSCSLSEVASCASIARTNAGTPRLERRHQTIRLRDRHWNPTSVASFWRRRPIPYERNATISWHFERDPIPYALETDWLVGAAGFEPLHLEIRSAELHPASKGFRRRSGAPLIRDAQVRVPPPGLRVLANSDSNMQRFESRRPNRPVSLQRVTYEGRSKTARHREVSQI